MRRTAAALPMVALCALLLPSLPLAEADAHPDPSGTWLLNPEFSDDIETKMQEAREQRRSRSGMGRSGGGRGGGTGGGGGGRGGGTGGGSRGTSPMGGGDRNPEEMRRRMQQFVQGFDVLAINYEDPMLSIVFADGRRRTFRTDGKKQSRKTVDGAVVTRAKWKNDGLLAVSTSNPRGGKTTETYELLTETDQLRVITDMQIASGMSPLKLVRVYDRQDIDSGDETGD